MSNLTTARASEILGREIAADTAIARFIADDAAQSEIIKLVDDLFEVYLDSKSAPQRWVDISCDGSLHAALTEASFYEEYEDDDDFHAVINEHLDDLTQAAYESRRQSLIDLIKGASSLRSLRDLLVEADEFAMRYDFYPSELYDSTDLPKFGGEEVKEDGACSWNENEVLFSFGEWVIQARDEKTGKTVIQDSCAFIIDDVEYRSDDRFLLGADQIDTIRFVRWREQDAISSVRDGEILIRAFDRDLVLLSELIERVKEAEANVEYDDAY